ncbi:MAG: hypothetical protein WCS18_12585, partial [Sphaerochaetaceae bacterium]
MEEAREQVQIQANDHNPVRIRRRRPGDRKDGWRVRSAAPMEALIPYVMVTRNDSQNLISDCFESSAVDRFVHQKRNEGLDGFGITHAARGVREAGVAATENQSIHIRAEDLCEE